MTTKEGAVVRLYLDHPKVGCGWRGYVVVQVGRVWAKLVCIENAEPLKVPVGQIAHARPMEFKPRRLARRIKANAITYHREDSGSVKVARKMLNDMPARGAV
jgi:hypothetical protein